MKAKISYIEYKLTILKTIRTLTPPKVMECSTQEVCALMAEDRIRIDARVVASLIGGFRREGLVVARRYLQRNLWKLTAKGLQYIHDQDVKKSR